MIYRKIMPIIISVSLVLLTGCGAFGSKIPELTAEEQKLVVEYASESLLKYDSKNGDKYVEVKDKDFDGEADTITEQPMEENANESSNIIEDNSTSNDSEYSDSSISSDSSLTDIGTEGETTTNNSSNGTSISEGDKADDGTLVYDELEDALNVESDLDFTYLGYEIKDSYPDSLDSYFVMSATGNNKLLIIRFDIANITNEDIQVNVSNLGLERIKNYINGNGKNALTTMLINDLRYFKGDLKPGEKQEVVVVGEYQPEELENINNLDMEIYLNGKKVRVKLQ